MIYDRDPRAIKRQHSSPVNLSFRDGVYRGYIVATPEYAYGVVGKALGFRGRLDFFVPRQVLVIPNRLLLKGWVPSSLSENRDAYIWVEEVMVSESEGRRYTYVASDLLEYQKTEEGFEVSVASPFPLTVHRAKNPGRFSSEVLKHQPRR